MLSSTSTRFFLPLALIPLLVRADGFERLLDKRADLSVQVGGSPKQCGETDVTVTGGKSPYSVSLVPPGGGTSLMVLPPISQEGKYSWTVNLAGGTDFVIEVSDVSGGKAQSSQLSVASSDDRSCLPGGSSDIGGQDSIFQFQSSVAPPAGDATTGGAAATTGGASATGTGKGATATTGNPTPGATAGSGGGTTTSYVTAGATPTSDTGNGASGLVASSGLAGLAAAFAALLM